MKPSIGGVASPLELFTGTVGVPPAQDTEYLRLKNIYRN
jgi:hypothetical protein